MQRERGGAGRGERSWKAKFIFKNYSNLVPPLNIYFVNI